MLVVGDSLSAAYNMEIEQGWVSLLQQRLKKEGFDYQVKNLSVSGYTTANGLNTLIKNLDNNKKTAPKLVIIALGGNDGLRTLSLKKMYNNLSQMIDMSQQTGAQVVLAGVRLPPNLGKTYVKRFYKTYLKLNEAHTITFVPKLLANIGGYPALMQADKTHPTAAAQEKVLANVWEYLAPILEK